MRGKSRNPLKIGAGGRIRTDDLLITNQLLYQLSYASIGEGFYRRHAPAELYILCQPRRWLNRRFGVVFGVGVRAELGKVAQA